MTQQKYPQILHSTGHYFYYRMATSSHHHHHHNSDLLKMNSLLPPFPFDNPTTSTDHSNPNPTATTTTTKPPITPSPQDTYLSESTHLTRVEVMKRRSHYLKQLAKCYRVHYWGLMEQLRIQHREYVWKYGLSPFAEDQHHHHYHHKEEAVLEEDGMVEGSGENINNNNNNSNSVALDAANDSSGSSNGLCAFYGCKLKAMALTSFCQLHILSDPKQLLYKPCDYVIKSAQAGPITCGKPILRATVPSLCSVHFQKAQKHVTRALKKAGLNVSSSNKVAPKFHLVVAEFVHEIQGKRKAALKANRKKIAPKLEHDS